MLSRSLCASRLAIRPTNATRLLSTIPVTVKKSLVEKVDEKARRLLFGERMIVPTCPWSAPRTWPSGWRFYARTMMFAVPGVIVFVAGGMCVLVLTKGAVMVASDLAETYQERQALQHRTTARPHREPAAAGPSRTSRLGTGVFLASFGGVAGLGSLSFCYDVWALVTKDYRNLSACRFSMRLGTGIGFTAMGVFGTVVFGRIGVQEINAAIRSN